MALLIKAGISPAEGINIAEFTNGIKDELFEKIIACLRIAVPYTGIIMSTRESAKTRKRALEVGVSQISGGSRTSVGGYAEEETEDENSAQFEVVDRRSLDEVINWLLRLGYIPSFCTACYRKGRTGDRFMQLVNHGKISHCCTPNALLTLKEYVLDYASEDTKEKGENLISKEVEKLPKEIQGKTVEYLDEINKGKRDFRF